MTTTNAISDPMSSFYVKWEQKLSNSSLRIDFYWIQIERCISRSLLIRCLNRSMPMRPVWWSLIVGISWQFDLKTKRRILLKFNLIMFQCLCLNDRRFGRVLTLCLTRLYEIILMGSRTLSKSLKIQMWTSMQSRWSSCILLISMYVKWQTYSAMRIYTIAHLI